MRLLIQTREVHTPRQAPTRERISLTAAMAEMGAAFLCPQTPDAEEKPESVRFRCGGVEGLEKSSRRTRPDLVLGLTADIY